MKISAILLMARNKCFDEFSHYFVIWQFYLRREQCIFYCPFFND